MNDIIESYQQNFKSPIGAYIYLLLNQEMPNFFSINQNGEKPLGPKISKVLQEAGSLDEVIKGIDSIPNLLFLHEQEGVNPENDVSKSRVLKIIKNIAYLDIDFEKNDSWKELKGLIEYNDFSLFISDKQEIMNKIKELVEEFSLKDLNLNPNFYPLEFLKDFKESVNCMCQVLNMKSENIGMGILSLHHKNEYGDFTGYNEDDKIVFNKMEVFAHEWLHFIDYSLGLNNLRIIDVFETLRKSKNDNFDIIWSKNLDAFDQLINDHQDVEKMDLKKAIPSISGFLHRYSLNKETFHQEVEKLTIEFLESDYQNDYKKSLETFMNHYKNLLNDNFPTRYLIFIEAHFNSFMKQEKQNNFLNFSHHSDVLMGDDYMKSRIEVFARTFEVFVDEELAKKKLKSEVVKNGYHDYMYPQGELREKINEQWRDLWPKMLKAITAREIGNLRKSKDYVTRNIDKIRKQAQHPENSVVQIAQTKITSNPQQPESVSIVNKFKNLFNR